MQMSSQKMQLQSGAFDYFYLKGRSFLKMTLFICLHHLLQWSVHPLPLSHVELVDRRLLVLLFMQSTEKFTDSISV